MSAQNERGGHGLLIEWDANFLPAHDQLPDAFDSQAQAIVDGACRASLETRTFRCCRAAAPTSAS